MKNSYVSQKKETDLENLLQMASRAESVKDWEKAISFYNIIIENYPHYNQAYLNCGLAYIKISFYTKAYEVFEQSLNLKRDPKILFQIGSIFYKNYQFKEAVNFFLECISTDKNDPRAYFYAALCLSRIEEYDKALFFLDMVLKLDYNNLAALKEKLEVLYRLKKYSETKRLALESIKKYPDHYEFYRYLGFAELFLGNFIKAEDYFKKALTKNPLWSKYKDDFDQLEKKKKALPDKAGEFKSFENQLLANQDQKSLRFLYFYKNEKQKPGNESSSPRNKKAI